jgi:hypothetical protein
MVKICYLHFQYSNTPSPRTPRSRLSKELLANLNYIIIDHISVIIAQESVVACPKPTWLS